MRDARVARGRISGSCPCALHRINRLRQYVLDADGARIETMGGIEKVL